MIGLVVEQGIMPPWYASPEHGSWRGDRSLTATARAAVLDWVAAGAPEGDVAETPIRYEWSEDWAIGEPDEIFQLKRVQEIPAEGVIDYRLVPGDRIVERDMWVERMQVLPTDKSVVHHASVFFQEPLSGEAPVALVDALVPWQRRKPKQFGPKQLLWGYAPGRPSSTYEPGVARYLPKGSRLLFEMHYTTLGVETTDQTRIGLVLARRPPRLEAETHALAFEDIDIEPGGTAEYSMEYEFEYPVRLRALVPHMHYRGSYFWADLIRPDGSEERLIEIPTWDFDWQHSYVFRDGPFAPAGTRIRMTGGFDNTVSNVDNPDPARRVPYGVQSWDEMLKLGVEWVRPLDGESP